MDQTDYRDLYVSEALEHLETINQALLELEENPKLRQHIDLIFRSAHTIKGMAATMGYDQTREVCKNIENTFDKIRKDELKLTKDLTNVLFKCLDYLQQLISDENKKVDLTNLLQMLENPQAIQEGSSSIRTSFKAPTIRVKMSELDSLVNMVGELVISKMRLEKMITKDGTDETKQLMIRIDRLVKDLQYQSMKIRLVPIDQIFNRFTRLVRDTSQTLGKEVNLIMEGSGIELDRTILDSITDPLLHILRNCIDHGLETPEERKRKGKPSSGNIYLTAFRIGDQIGIKIQDDGRGINLEKIKDKAIDQGLISKEEADRMSKDEAIKLVGTPGLSTSTVVNDISGRGVGMDVVIRRVEDVGGNVKITTEEGLGTITILYLPLSVSIIGGLLVNILDQKFVVPLSSVATTIKVPLRNVKSVHGVDAFQLRDEVVPLIRLADKLDLKGHSYSLSPEDSLTVVIVKKNGKLYGLVVDSFDNKQEVVIKKIADATSSTDSFTNATILSDGRVALILDPSILI